MSISSLHGSDPDRWTLIRENLKQDLAPPDKEPTPFPTVWQAVEVKNVLSGLSLPLEIVEPIMDFAEYWPWTSARMKDSVAVLSDGRARCTEFYSTLFSYHHWVPEAVGDTDLVCTEPLAIGKPAASEKKRALWAGQSLRSLRGKESENIRSMVLPTRGRHPCRKIVFSIVSREDSRDSSVGMSASWFDAVLRKSKDDPNAEDLEVRRAQSVSNAIDGDSVASSKSGGNPSRGFYKSMRSMWSHERHQLQDKSRASTTRRRDEGNPPVRQIGSLVFENGANSKLNKHGVVTWRYDDAIEELPTARDGHHMTTSSTGRRIVREIEMGDSIILRARNRGIASSCMNYVVSATVCVYWAV